MRNLKGIFDFESSGAKLAPPDKFKSRLLKAVLLSFTIVGLSLFLGMAGYRFFEGLSWTDSFLNASMILGGMGPVTELAQKNAKIFAGFYAIYCGIALIGSMTIIITPIYHRFLHKFHVDPGKDEDAGS